MCKRVAYNVLTAEIYKMVYGFDIETVIKAILENMLRSTISLIL